MGPAACFCQKNVNDLEGNSASNITEIAICKAYVRFLRVMILCVFY